MTAKKIETKKNEEREVKRRRRRGQLSK